EPDDVAARLAERRERLAVGLPGCDLGADLVARQLELAARELVARLRRVGLRNVDADVPDAAELGDRLVRVVERLAVPSVLVLDLLDALALHRARDDGGRSPDADPLFLPPLHPPDLLAAH